jgi:hypothetical protein
MKIPLKLNSERMLQGMASEYLPIISYMLQDYSQEVAENILEAGYDLYGK